MSRVPLWRRYARLFGPDPAADVQDELRFHLEAKVDDLIAQGWSAAEARREAERQFGDLRAVESLGERMGRQREGRSRRREYWEACAQDVRFALRTLRRDRGFAAITVMILALGIAANTAVFSVVDTVLLRDLPFQDSQQLAWLRSGKNMDKKLAEAGSLSSVTYTVDAWEEFERHNRSFQSVGSYNPFFGNSEYTLTGRGEPQSVQGVMVSANFFGTLGVQPARGRLFLPEECRKGGRLAVILSDALWRRHFNADPAIVGQNVTLSKQSVTVVGVLPPGFDFGSVFSPGLKVDLYVPAVMDILRNWGNTLALVGRLKAGVSVAQAQAEADVVFARIKAAHPQWWGDYTSTVTSLKDFVTAKLRRSLIVLWSAVGLVLLLVCVNVSNLMLARTIARSKEFAMRTALGAGRGRLFRQLLTESLLLAGAGALAGLALAFALTFYLARQGSIALPLLSNVKLDGAALGWTALITAVSALLFGLVPGLRLAGGNIQEALKDRGPGMSSGLKHERLRGILVVSEVALACVLLIGAGLLLRSFLSVLDVDLGFQPSRAAVLKVDYEGNDVSFQSNAGEHRAAALQEMLRQVKALPGVEAAGVVDMLPLGRNRSWGLKAKGHAYAKDEVLSAMVRIATPGYLDAMGIRLRAGRDFSWRDTEKSELVIIVNEAAARQFWQGEDPLGRVADMSGNNARVIGIVADVRTQSLEAAAGPEMYLSAAQAEPEGAELVVRTKLAPEALAGSLMRTLRTLNPSQPGGEFRSLERIVDHSVSPRRFFVLLVAGFAGLGLVLAALGIYGVISYSVTRQTQEIGIRVVLGATAGRVQLGVVSGALRLVGLGVLLGAVVSLGAARWLASLLFGTRPTDPATFSGVVLLLVLVALVAGYIPARRASRVNPLVAIRSA